jgi:hypothetical protein
MFPTVNFRIVYDYYRKNNPDTASKRYLQILHLASREGEKLVDNTLSYLFDKQEHITLDTVKERMKLCKNENSITDIKISEVDLKSYDNLIENQEAVYV